MFKITNDWLKVYSRSGKGGWNREQLASIGISWPPPKGWLDAQSGREIDQASKLRFEALKGQSIEGKKIDAGKKNMASNPVYRTTPDGKGGWTGQWVGEARYPWTKAKH